MSNDQPNGPQPEQPHTPPPTGDPYAQPPNQGQVPPSYGQQPPAYGQQPPAYGQPPAFDPAAAGYGQPVEPPKSILNAVKLMYVGAALSVIGLILGFATAGSVEDELRRQNPDFTEAEIDAAVTFGIVFAALIGLIGVALWIWMAIMNKKGRSWARTVATVLGGLNIVFTLIGFSQGGSAASMISNVISVALAAAILYLLYRPESSEYYAAQSRRF